MPYLKRGFRKPGSHGGAKTMHDAVCSNCNQPCQVPFRPSGNKPIYCRNCFPKMTGDRPSRPFVQDRMAPPAPAANDEIKKQLEGVNARLERLIFIVQSLVPAASTPAAPIAPSAKKKLKK